MAKLDYVKCSICGNILDISKDSEELQNSPNFYVYCDKCFNILQLDKEEK